jgi:DNA-binding NtrC family response regulator
MTTPAPVYVVDDDASVRDAVGRLVRSAGWTVETFASAHEFLAMRRRSVPSCLILDVQLPGLSGLDLQQELAKVGSQIPIIFITGHGNIPMTVRAMKAGAIEVLTKPCRDDDLLNAIEQAIHRGRQMEQLEPAEEGLDPEGEARSEISFSEVVGQSEALRSVLKAVSTVAPTDSTVLISGETGTGKELIARAIHNISRRRSKPFVKLNCAAIPSGLLESELFGHEKGAFTGAILHRSGRFELANGGTLFLDEIGDIPVELQPKLLRVLQEQEFERVGGTRTIRVAVRLVAATNGDLATMVAEKRFRSDLYYRLNVFPIVMPPLRDRREDILPLVRHFVQKYARRMQKPIDTISPTAAKAMTEYQWQGNVRELANVVERGVILCQGRVLQEEHLGAVMDKALAPGSPAAGGVAAAVTGPLSVMPLAQIEKQAIADALGRAHGNKSRAAALLGLTRMQLYTRLKRFGLGS